MFMNMLAVILKFRVSVEEFTEEGTAEFKILGFGFARKKDTLRLGEPKFPFIGRVLTKREVPSIISSIFDSLGIVAPVMVRAKLIMQEVYRVYNIHTVSELERSSWSTGPQFITKDSSEWPAQPELPALAVVVASAKLSVLTAIGR